MKAYVCEKYGPPEVLQLRGIDKPVPKSNEVLIQMMATTASAADLNVRGLAYIPSGLGLVARLMLGFNKPKISVTGSVFAGIVEETGTDVTSFRPGDKVFGSTPKLGAYAEFICVDAGGAISLLPENISFGEAATVPYGALTALYFLRDKAKTAGGQKVLINGASGGVGVYAVQLANYFGAEVTAVCSGKNHEFVRSIGAHRTIDYTKEDYTRGSEKWDIIFDVVVGRTSYPINKKVLNPKGFYLAVAGGITDMLYMMITSIGGSRKVIFGGGADCEKKENLELICDLIEKKKIQPVTDKIFNFEELVEAHRYVESGSKRGNIAIVF